MELFTYQKKGIPWLARRNRAYLADEMGLGKTVQTILALRLANKKGWGPPTEHLRVICPASAVDNWYEELEKWGWDRPAYVYSYSKAIRDPGGIRDVRSTVVLDEAHYCKTPSAKRTRAALGLARKAPRAYLLSGTPMPNDPTELWPPVKYLWPELAEAEGITTAQQWMHRFCKVRATPWGPKVYGVHNGAILREMLNKFMLRRRLADVGMELPPLRVTTQYLRKDAVALDLGEYEDVDSGEEAYTSTLRRLLGEAKAPAVARLLDEELAEGAYSRIVVLYHHRAVGSVLRNFLTERGRSVVGFDGSTPQGERTEARQAFQEGRAQVFLAQQTAAGVAINLTRASEIVLVEPSWVPDENFQAIKRIHRIGQAHPCRARLFAVPGTLDSALMGTIQRKMQFKQEVFQDA